MKAKFDQSALAISKLVTNAYSTSFSLGIRLFYKAIRPDIYAIYGFVRYADEIVDSFHSYDQPILFDEFEENYKLAIQRGISLNPILNSFQKVVNQYDLDELVDSFMASMRKDLYKTNYTTEAEYKDYIYGSADAVGLMCLKVFVKGDVAEYNRLKPFAMKLGSAFQKVNFLRDLKDDYEELGRAYFPELSLGELNAESKYRIIQDIERDFEEAYKGIVQLPHACRLGVYVAYKYYLLLLRKIAGTKAEQIMEQRIRISNPRKISVLLNSYFRLKLNVL